MRDNRNRKLETEATFAGLPTRMRERINELKLKRDALVLQKRDLETKLTAIKNLVRSSGRMPPDKYKICCESQTGYSRKIISIETQLLPIKQEIQRLSDDEFFARSAPSAPSEPFKVPVKTLVLMLREVRDRWQDFSCDDAMGTSTERLQAAQFVRDLNPIIHFLLDSPETGTQSAVVTYDNGK